MLEHAMWTVEFSYSYADLCISISMMTKDQLWYWKISRTKVPTTCIGTNSSCQQSCEEV